VETLRFEGVRKSFGEHAVLQGLSAEVPLKGVTFIVGKSGSGKSVLCRMAVGLLKPDAGAVSLLGEAVHALPERKLVKLRAQVPYLVQGPALLDWLTLLDNVKLAKPEGGDHPAREALARVGLQDVAERYPPEVGPGVKKRAAIARALLLGPKYLLLDEPTTGLDRGAAGQVNAALQTLKGQGLGALVVSHDHRALEALADHVVEVHEGVVGYQGNAHGFLAAR
jgi:phospholipid/cholesterol/gamma-HCH transport system ATP-binding protein